MGNDRQVSNHVNEIVDIDSLVRVSSSGFGSGLRLMSL